MSKEEIALQLTLKSIEKSSDLILRNSMAKGSLEFSNQVVSMYNNIYKNLDLSQTIGV